MENEKQPKTAFVLEGGAMRGLFTAGVTDVLMENKIEFDGAVGVSAGAAAAGPAVFTSSVITAACACGLSSSPMEGTTNQ